MKLSKTAFYPDNPTRKQWEQLTIDELVTLAKRNRSIKYPFKKFLVDYMLKIGLR